MNRLDELCIEIDKFKVKSLKMFSSGRFITDDKLEVIRDKAYWYRINSPFYQGLIIEADGLAFKLINR